MKRRAWLAVPLLLSTGSAWAAPAKPAAKPRPKLIALDPGHGGTDPGALGVNGVQEKNVVIAVARTLVAMAQRGTGNDSRRFADTVVATFGKSGVRLLPRSHREAGFAVLTSPDIPAALVELGYLSNSQDSKLLTVRQHQMALA